MDTQDYAERNRDAWNEAAGIHRQARKLDLRQAVQEDSFNVLGDVERHALEGIGIAGKRVAQLCCNNGRELISILKMGAAYGVGFDISDEFIEEARQLSSLAQTNCDFVRTNVLDIGHDYDAGFDLVFISVGSLTWIHDLQSFFAVAARLLTTCGHLFIYEIHPFTDMLAVDGDPEYDPKDELKIAFSYFRTQPWVSDTGLDYIGGTSYDAKTSICFPHSLAGLLSALVDNGFVLEGFREYPHDIANSFAHLEKYQKVPLPYSLLACKGQCERTARHYHVTGEWQ